MQPWREAQAKSTSILPMLGMLAWKHGPMLVNRPAGHDISLLHFYFKLNVFFFAVCSAKSMPATSGWVLKMQSKRGGPR